jgi:hypothetical protein
MNDETNVLAAERAFFTALVEGRADALDQILSNDFLLIDVMQGAEISKAALLAVIESGQLRFDAIQPVDSHVRLYQTTAVVIGRTEMKGRFEGTPFAASSRYTHVYVERDGAWRLVSAQGTPISGE